MTTGNRIVLVFELDFLYLSLVLVLVPFKLVLRLIVVRHGRLFLFLILLDLRLRLGLFIRLQLERATEHTVVLLRSDELLDGHAFGRPSTRERCSELDLVVIVIVAVLVLLLALADALVLAGAARLSALVERTVVAAVGALLALAPLTLPFTLPLRLLGIVRCAILGCPQRANLCLARDLLLRAPRPLRFPRVGGDLLDDVQIVVCCLLYSFISSVLILLRKRPCLAALCSRYNAR